MDNQDFSIVAPPAVLPAAAPPIGGYPTHATAASASAESAFGEPSRSAKDARGSTGGGLRRRVSSILAAIAAAFAKFFAAIKGFLLLLPKLKLLTTSGTALVSVAAYSLFWGWQFAAGFVALLFLHEMGHVIALRREGIKASTPMFIPFLGAAIFAKSLGDNALAEARVGLAGPILGSLAAGAVALAGALTGSDFLLALAYVGFLINLFNLLPVVPLDGGRAMAAMAPWMWFLGLGAMVAMALIYPNPIILIILLFAGMETWRRWQQRKTRSLEQAAYYRVSPRNRMLVGAVYITLIVLLAFGMHETHILTSGGHGFGSI